MKKLPLLVLVGPTAVGKTELSLKLAEKFNSEIISGDSMQVYRGMDIGTAKATAEERARIPHHLIDICEPDHLYSVSEFQQKVQSLIPQIIARDHLPFVVGGSGLYVQSVTHGYQFSEAAGDTEFRAQCQQFAEEKGNEALLERLLHIDPETASRLHPNDLRRIIRGLEVYHLTGQTLTEQLKTQQQEMPYDAWIIGLTRNRQELYDRVNIRVDQMLQEGLIEEVKSLLEKGYSPDLLSMQGLGYKEIVQYIEGHWSFEEAVDQLKQSTRRFAKRQLSWFRRMKEIHWYDLTNQNPEKVLENIAAGIAGKFPWVGEYNQTKL